MIEAAVRVMDEEGLDAVTMRRVGRELGVEAMSLYNHVADKEDLLGAMCEHVLAEFRVPEAHDWTEAARLGGREYRRILLAHPSVITLMTERKGPITNPDSLRGYEFALEIFHRAGLTGEEAVKAFHTFGGYILGFVTMELGLMIRGEEGDHEIAHRQMAELAAAAGLVRLHEVLPHFLACDDDEQFEFGLDLLIEGIRARVANGLHDS